MPAKDGKKQIRSYPLELKKEAVQMFLDGHSATSIATRLGLPRTNLIYKWRDALKERGDGEDESEQSLEELQVELSRVRRERDILKKALAILGRNES